MFAQVSRDNDPTNAMFLFHSTFVFREKTNCRRWWAKKQRMVLKETDSRKLTRWSPPSTKIRTGKSATQNSGSFYHYSHHHHHDCHSHISSSRSSWPAPPSLWSQYRWCLELFLSWSRTRQRQAAGRKQQSLKSDFLNPAQRVFFCLIPSTNHME